MSKTSKTMSRKEILIANLSKEGKDKELKKIERIIEDDGDFFEKEIKLVEDELKRIRRSIEDFRESLQPMSEQFLALVLNEVTLEKRLQLLTNTKEKYG